ncbi:MAG TPA: ParB/RepB/Spo0J family partition protein [Sedimentisphaerales bacterium]|nr:ParB/RepB/Spo0J family partition protein [Sedimentisphaerales bacterium]HUU15596.1 ParB/RepB/Spo0J family partition protein [Sedimentisphaerales bacterium]
MSNTNQANNTNFKLIPLDQIVPTKDNMRKNIEKDEDFPELVASIMAGGVRDPIHVRVHPDQPGKFELRDGERRYRASIAAKVKTIPAIVHDKMDDEDALDMTFIGNKFRKDLSPMEEAEEIANCIERLGGNAAAIAKRIGKEEGWVRQRANVWSNLSKIWKAIFKDIDKNEEYRSWTIAHLSIIARLPEAVQDEIMDNIFEPEFMPISQLNELIAEYLKLLSKAKWDLDDQTLVPKAGACSKCNKRTGSQPMLWEDAKTQTAAGDKCIDSACWKNKLSEWLKRTFASLKEKHPNLVLIVNDYPNQIDAQWLQGSFGTYLSKWDHTSASKGAKGALPALCLYGKGMGNLTYVKTKKSGSSTKAIIGKPTTLTVRRKMLGAKRWAQVLLDLQEKVEASGVKDINHKDPITALMVLVAVYGNDRLPLCDADELKTIKSAIKEGPGKALELLWESFKPTLIRHLVWSGPITQTPINMVEEAERIASLIKADVKAMLKDVSGRKGFTEPKSWAGLNADGTPKKVKPAKKAKTEKAKPKKSGKKDKVQSCRICKCTDDKACIGDDGEPCHWVEPDLCSNCHGNLILITNAH